MRVIIGGSRSIASVAALEAAIVASGFAITEVLTSDSRGVDALAEAWARGRGIPVKVYRPDWSRYGGRAERIRNEEMLARAEACLAIWDGYSRGTAALIELCEKKGMRLAVHRCNPQRATEGATTRVTAAITRPAAEPQPPAAAASPAPAAPSPPERPPKRRGPNSDRFGRRPSPPATA
jgi:hypothetical protein